MLTTMTRSAQHGQVARVVRARADDAALVVVMHDE